MFSKENRYSFKKGAPKKNYQSPFFVLRYDFEAVRGLECGIVISKKVDKSAVVRNRLKRKIVEKIKKIVPLSTKVRIVIYVKKGLNEKGISSFEENLENAFNDLKIIK